MKVPADLHPQLAAIANELDDACKEASRLVSSVDDGQFEARPTDQSWSIAECIEHLNLTSRAFLPRIQARIEAGRDQKIRPRRSYRRDLLGWLLSRSMEPPVRVKVATAPPFVPRGRWRREDVLAEFLQLQDALYVCLRAASHLDLSKLVVTSPFNGRVKYNLYSAFRIVAAHQRRHLWQAEQVRHIVSGRR